MYKRSLHMYAAGLFAALLAFLTLTLTTALPARAATITNSDIGEQKRVVMVELVDVLEAQVKLLQLIYIQRLQMQVAYLQTLADK